MTQDCLLEFSVPSLLPATLFNSDSTGDITFCLNNSSAVGSSF